MSMSEKKHHQGKSAHKDESQEIPPTVHEGDAKPAAEKSLSTKEYDKVLRDLHVELVKLQEWVQHAGLKVCVIFEGRDGAGKGGTIKAITERVSPRVFRVVALASADRASEVADVHPALHSSSAGGRRDRDLRPQLVQPGGR